MKRIQVRVNEAGEISIETSGFSGASCLEATRGVEAALGGRVASDEATGEMYQTQDQDQTENAGW